MRDLAHRKRHVGRWLSAVLTAMAVAALVVPAHGAPGAESIERLTSVNVDQGRPTVDPEGALDFTVAAQVATTTPYLEIRLQVFNPGGSLLYQKTEVRHDVAAGTTAIRFQRDLADLSLDEGRYPARVRVLATDTEPTLIDDRMLVIDDDRGSLSTAIVLRFNCAPGRDPEGRFVIDPATMTRERDEVIEALSLAGPGRPISAALPPIMLEDWLVASTGHDVVGAAGLGTRLPDDAISTGYADALVRLGEIAASPQVDLLDVPYAEPDIRGLQAMMAVDDLFEHYRAGRSVYQISISATPTAGTAIWGDSFSKATLEIMEDRGLEFFLLGGAGSANETTPTVGAHPVVGSSAVALVVDDAAGDALAADDAGHALVDHLFDAAMESTSAPVTAQITLGPGAGGTVERLASVLDTLDSLDWVDLVTASEAAKSVDGVALSLPDQANQGSQAPLGYWGEVLEARRSAQALRAAAGVDDPDAESAFSGVLTAESRCWAGPDGGWGLADRGRAYAAAAGRTADSVLAEVRVSSEDITLAGRTGIVPLSIINGSSKPLTVTVVASGDSARIGPPGTFELALRPAENFLTLPVTMSAALSDRLKVDILAGDTIIATTFVMVRASYLDQLAIAGFVVLVLAGLLFYIRRRVMT